MDKCREQFEEWAKDKYILAVSKYGGYRAVSTKNAFDAWQASRQALVVELPKPEDSNWGCLPYEKGLVDGMNAMLEDCQSAVERVGLSCK